jgi:glycosyltransferase involved in cell wall biosynthesis
MVDYFKSLEHQTFSDFEVIIVDDCSTDGSFQKLQEFASKSSLSIKLFQSDTNSGPGNARNIGLDHALGEWITFVDNDDWVADTFLEEINVIIKNENVNAVIYDYYGALNGKLSLNHSMYIPIGGRKTVSDCVISVRNHTFGKFYKFTECYKLRFPKIRRCEDVAYVSQALALCGNAYYLNKPLYYYRQRPTSLSNKNNLDESDMLKAFGILNEALGEKYSDELCDKSVADLLYGVLLMMCKAGKSNKEINRYIRSYEEKYPEWSKSKLIPYLGLPKKIFLYFAKIHSAIGLKVIAKIHSHLISKGS